MNLNSNNKIPIPEYEKHERTYLLWPNRSDNWRNSGAFAQRGVALLANSIAEFEPVTLGTNVPIKAQLDPRIKIVPMEYDDIWIRDTAPTFYRNENNVQAVGWDFNSWGGLLPEYSYDKTIPDQITNIECLPIKKIDFVFEGGACVVGSGESVFCVKECILNPNRNKKMQISIAEEILKRYLHAKEIIWFEKGFEYDETGGHADNILFFSDAENVFVSFSKNPSDANYIRSHQCFDILENFNIISGNKYKIHKLPLPLPLEITKEESKAFISTSGAIIRDTGTPMCASYANSYVINGGIVIPKFGIPEDDVAAQIIKNVHPEKCVIQIPSREFVLGGGAVHCITKEIPS